MSRYPIVIEGFHNTLLKLRGFMGIESGVENLEQINTDRGLTSSIHRKACNPWSF